LLLVRGAQDDDDDERVGDGGDAVDEGGRRELGDRGGVGDVDR
jgi:hypothetical protein